MVLEPRHRARQQARRRDHHDADPDATGAAAGHRGDVFACAVEVGQDGAGEARHFLTVSGRLGSARRSDEQRQPEHSLDLGQRLADCRLRQGQELGRPAEVAELVECDDQLQVLQLQIRAQHAVDVAHDRFPARWRYMQFMT